MDDAAGTRDVVDSRRAWHGEGQLTGRPSDGRPKPLFRRSTAPLTPGQLGAAVAAGCPRRISRGGLSIQAW